MKQLANNNFKKDLVHNLTQIQDDRVMQDFLSALLTSDEFATLAVRLQIFKKLLKNKTQREIAKELGVGIATVTRGAAEMREKKEKVEQMIKK